MLKWFIRQVHISVCDTGMPNNMVLMWWSCYLENWWGLHPWPGPAEAAPGLCGRWHLHSGCGQSQTSKSFLKKDGYYSCYCPGVFWLFLILFFWMISIVRRIRWSLLPILKSTTRWRSIPTPCLTSRWRGSTSTKDSCSTACTSSHCTTVGVCSSTGSFFRKYGLRVNFFVLWLIRNEEGTQQVMDPQDHHDWRESKWH